VDAERSREEGTATETEEANMNPEQGALPLDDGPDETSLKGDEMHEAASPEQAEDRTRGGNGVAGAGQPRPTWLESMDGRDGKQAAAPAPKPVHRAAAPANRTPAPLPPDPPAEVQDAVDRAIERLRNEARRAARSDAANGVPEPSAEGPTNSELELRDRCRGYFQRWFAQQRRETAEKVAVAEEQASDKLGRIALGIDRFQRLTNELIRLKARYSLRKGEVSDELDSDQTNRRRGIPTPVYAAALGFLGLVEFFANAPVFAALFPRDPLTERQVRVLTETSEGWFAGVERVVAQLIFHPDATILAAGVITFLCVLCHFFGSSLRELVMQREKKERRYTVQGRSALENAVPIVLTSIGLVLVLGVLYEARVLLGDVGEERYQQDMAQVEEYRREAGWLRVDGELLAANELTNRADDLQEAAVELREYSHSMARLTFPILLLNLTLVLCAISAAYFHRRDARKEHFNESPFEDQRQEFIEQAEGAASETSRLLAEVVRDIRALKSALTMGPISDWPSVVHQLESVITLYRAENGRARGMDPAMIPAFSGSPSLDIGPPDPESGLATRSPEDYEAERAELSKRFNEVRSRFNDEATATW
jgi:hypothetical protein